MDIFGIIRFPCERAGRSRVHRNVWSSGDLQDCESVTSGLLDFHIPEHGGESFHLQNPGVEGEEDRRGIVNSRIGIDDDAHYGGAHQYQLVRTSGQRACMSAVSSL